MEELITPLYDVKQLHDVYEPSEDTFLFIDALESELGYLRQLQPTCFLEIGSGSGLISTAVAGALQNCSFFTTDINLKACDATLATSILNKVPIEAVCMDLARSFREKVFDVLVFNPPYVVTDPVEVQGIGLHSAWAGGINGREIIDRLLPLIDSLLTNNGVFYLLLLKENDPEDVINILKGFHFGHKIIKERKILGEYLYVIKFNRC